MATFVNDLRLTELATGEGSGTWGTTTNQSLELIGESLGYATQQAFSSDADATTTVADGVSDPARAMYFKVTSAGSLSATRTLTIAPNTISRVMFIENATSGSQSIAISQGSGANVTILTGKTAVVYLDGAGSGAAVVDAMLGVDPGVTDTLTEVLVAGNTSGGTNIELSTTDKVQFRDAAIYINSSADGQLDLIADTEIQIAATTVDLNGNLDISGTATGASSFATAAGGTFTTAAGNDLNIVYPDGRSLFFKEAGTTTLTLDNAQGATFAGAVTTGGNITIGSTSISQTVLQFLSATDGANTIHFGDGTSADAYKGYINYNHTADRLELVGSGDITLDAVGDINLDADGGDINLKDDGTAMGRLGFENGDLNIANSRQDYDIRFKGMDGNTTPFTALTLDMSNAGAATFNASVTATGALLSSDSPLDVRMGTDKRIFFSGGIGEIGSVAGFQSLNTAGNALAGFGIRASSIALATSSNTRLLLSDNGAITATPSANGHAVFNNAGVDADFQVQSDTYTHALFVQGSDGNVGIGLTPTEHLHVGGRANAVLELQSSTTTGTGRVNFNDGANSGQILYSHNTNTMDFYSGGSYAMRLTSTGITAPQGIFIGGTAAANLLDDYEEGTWTPTIVGSTTAGAFTYSVREGTYTKVGNLVTVNSAIFVTGTATSPAGNVTLTGLPFSIGTQFPSFTIGWSQYITFADQLAAYGGGTQITLRNMVSGDNGAALSGSDFGSSFYLFISGSYHV